MREAPAFTTRALNEGASELLRHGEATGIRMDGVTLEAAIEADGRLLILMTDDVPYEERMSLHLFDVSSLHLLDTASIGAPYAPGLFGALELRPPDALCFDFIGDERWCVQLLPRPELRSPFDRDAPGVHRGLRASRHFRVRREAAR